MKFSQSQVISSPYFDAKILKMRMHAARAAVLFTRTVDYVNEIL